MRGCEPKITSETQGLLHSGFLLTEKCLSHFMHTSLNFINITLFLIIGNVFVMVHVAFVVNENETVFLLIVFFH